MKGYCVALIFLFAKAFLFAQTSNTRYRNLNKDFKTALEIKDSIAGPFHVSSGFGSKLEIREMLGFKEKNSSWFKITAPVDTLLTFDIVPKEPKDDFDFVIFKCAEPYCVEKITTNRVRPDRACFSINYDKNGSTGLSANARGTYIGGWLGAGYAAGLPVKKGDVLYLLVNFYSEKLPQPFTIYFYDLWPQKPVSLQKKLMPVVLENVLFQTNQSTLLKESFVTLDKLVEQLKKNGQLKIEIDGHTDNIGDEIQNQKLSEERAKEIVVYLISKGIDKSRLSFKGFGSTQPIASNKTEEGRKKNRRVTFSIQNQSIKKAL
jgi:hypothetical protein